MERLTIDPADFSEGAWEELYNACGLTPRTLEAKHNARPFKRAKGQIITAIQCCQNKAEEKLAEDEMEWAFDLNAAAEQLQHILEQDEKVACRKCGKSVKKSAAFVDKGEGEEAGRVFLYYSGICRETH